jgi:S-layer homology domain
MLVVNAGGYTPYPPRGNPDFSDVPPANVFFANIETAAHKAVVNGYPDGTFRPNNSIRRDEMAQIVTRGLLPLDGERRST